MAKRQAKSFNADEIKQPERGLDSRGLLFSKAKFFSNGGKPPSIPYLHTFGRQHSPEEEPHSERLRCISGTSWENMDVRRLTIVSAAPF